MCVFFFSSRRRHTSCGRDWSSDVCSSDLGQLWRDAKAAARRQPTSVPCLVSPRITAPEIAAAHERFRTGADRYITPELAAAAELAALRAERTELSRQLD